MGYLKNLKMKNLALCICVLFTLTITAQKKKKSVNAPKVPAVVSVAKFENLSAEMIKTDLYLFRIDGKAKKDTLLIKSFPGIVKPLEMVIKKFTAATTPLYCLTWKENNIIDTKIKKEEIASSFTQIWNPTTKTKLVENEEKKTKITEQVFLDKLKTASETQIKNRSEGNLLTILPNGDYVLSNKNSQTKYVFNATKQIFEEFKPAPAPVVAPKPVKKRR